MRGARLTKMKEQTGNVYENKGSLPLDSRLWTSDSRTQMLNEEVKHAKEHNKVPQPKAAEEGLQDGAARSRGLRPSAPRGDALPRRRHGAAYRTRCRATGGCRFE